jgi:hypothetical protein
MKSEKSHFLIAKNKKQNGLLNEKYIENIKNG